MTSKIQSFVSALTGWTPALTCATSSTPNASGTQPAPAGSDPGNRQGDDTAALDGGRNRGSTEQTTAAPTRERRRSTSCGSRKSAAPGSETSLNLDKRPKTPAVDTPSPASVISARRSTRSHRGRRSTEPREGSANQGNDVGKGLSADGARDGNETKATTNTAHEDRTLSITAQQDVQTPSTRGQQQSERPAESPSIAGSVVSRGDRGRQRSSVDGYTRRSESMSSEGSQDSMQIHWGGPTAEYHHYVSSWGREPQRRSSVESIGSDWHSVSSDDSERSTGHPTSRYDYEIRPLSRTPSAATPGMEMRTQCPCCTLSQAPFDALVTHSKAEIEGLHQQSFGGHPRAPPNDTMGRATSRHYSDYRTPESQVTVPPFANSNDDAVRNDNPTPNPLRVELTFAPVENNNNPESRITHTIQITFPEGIETEYRGARQQLRTGEGIPVAAARSGRHEWNPTVYTDRYDRHLNLPQAFYSDYQQCFTKCDELLEQLKLSQSETHSEAHENLTEDIQRRMLEKDWIELPFLYSKMHELLDILDRLSNALLSS